MVQGSPQYAHRTSLRRDAKGPSILPPAETEEEEQAFWYRRYAATPALTDYDVDAAFKYLPEGEREAMYRLKPAIARFSRKLQDAAGLGTGWIAGEDRQNLLQAALRFLIGTEELFREVSREEPIPSSGAAGSLGWDNLFLRSSSSPGWNVIWEDAVLDLFARRVRGLGERSEAFWDQHAAASSRRAEGGSSTSDRIDPAQP